MDGIAMINSITDSEPGCASLRHLHIKNYQLTNDHSVRLLPAIENGDRVKVRWQRVDTGMSMAGG